MLDEFHELMDFIYFFHYPDEVNVTVFYRNLWELVDNCFPRAIRKRLMEPLYYTSHTMYCLNRRNTAAGRFAKNGSYKNRTKLDQVNCDFGVSAELGTVCFTNGAFTSTIDDSFSLV